MNTRYGRHVMQDLADLSGQEIPGLRIERLASHYEGAIAERKARERANERELRLNIPHIHQVQQRIAEALEEEAGEIHAKLPIASVYDALQIVRARKDLDRDAGLRAFHGHLESMWRKNRTGSITASSYLKLREHYARNFPKSAVGDVIVEIGQRGYATLPRTDLHHIASQIETQADYDRLMVKYGLAGPHPHQVKARQYILAVLNDEEMDLSFDEGEEVADWVVERMKHDIGGGDPEEFRKKNPPPKRRGQQEGDGTFKTYEEAWAIAGPRLEQAAKETVEDLREVSEIGGEQLAVSDPYFMEGEGNHGYWVNINYGDLDDEEDSIDISFQLADSGPYEGIDEGTEGWGVNIMVDIVHYGGEILGGFTPYNYTSEVWTDQVDELKSRLTMIDPMSLADFIREDAVPSRIRGASHRQAFEDQLGRSWTFEEGEDDYNLLRDVDVDGYRLRMWDAGTRARTGQHQIRYVFEDPKGNILFEGDDYGASPMDAIDSDETVRGLLGFLTLQPGDTDEEYFADYTEEQMDFAETEAEDLQMWSMEGDEEYPHPGFKDWKGRE